MRRGELALNLMFLSPAIVGILLACLFRPPLNIGLVCACYAVGLAYLLRAKVSRQRRAFWTGCVFLAIGVFLNLIVLAILSRTGGTT